MRSARRGTARLAVLALLVPVTLAGCGSSDGDDEASTGAPAKTGAGTGTTVTIKDFAFQPTPLDAEVGATITVDNTDSAAHTLTADDKSFDTGTIEGEASGRITLTKAGEFTYHCAIHDYMKGVIRVTG